MTWFAGVKLGRVADPESMPARNVPQVVIFAKLCVILVTDGSLRASAKAVPPLIRCPPLAGMGDRGVGGANAAWAGVSGSSGFVVDGDDAKVLVTSPAVASECAQANNTDAPAKAPTRATPIAETHNRRCVTLSPW